MAQLLQVCPKSLLAFGGIVLELPQLNKGQEITGHISALYFPFDQDNGPKANHQFRTLQRFLFNGVPPLATSNFGERAPNDLVELFPKLERDSTSLTLVTDLKPRNHQQFPTGNAGSEELSLPPIMGWELHNSAEFLVENNVNKILKPDTTQVHRLYREFRECREQVDICFGEGGRANRKEFQDFCARAPKSVATKFRLFSYEETVLDKISERALFSELRFLPAHEAFNRIIFGPLAFRIVALGRLDLPFDYSLKELDDG